MMKKIIFIISCLIVSTIFTSCEKETTTKNINSIFIVPSSNSTITENMSLLFSTTPYKVSLAAGILSPVLTEIKLKVEVDKSLVQAYNTMENTQYSPMPSGSYTLTKTDLFIPKDTVVSQQTELIIRSNKLEFDKSYLLPVKIASVTAPGVKLNAIMPPKYYVIRVPTPVIGNLSDGKPAKFSQGRNPERANDGNTDGNWRHNSVCETGPGNQEFWEVDLGTVSPRIDTIRIWNRTDCCETRTSNFYVFISDVPFTGTTVESSLNQEGVYHYYQEGKAGLPTEMYPNVSGRYVRIQNSTTESLTLAEVTVIGIKP